MPSQSYRTLLRTPGAAAFFFAAAGGRIGIAMTSLGILWLVHARTGSYALAGLVTGGFALAEALVGPQLARLIDHFGQTRVLPLALLAHSMAVVALLALTKASTPGWLMAVGGVLVGATIPQYGALSAARWSALLRAGQDTALPAAFSLEALSNGLAYLIGPVLVSTVAASGYAERGTVLAAGLVVTGGLALAAQRRSAPPPAFGDTERRRTSHTLLAPAFVVLIGINLAVGIYFGAMQVSVAAFAVQHGAAEAAAPLYAVSSSSGLLAGWLYGLRRWRAAPAAQLAAVTAGLALACLPLLVADSPLRLGIALAVVGMAIPPILVLCSVLAEASVHRTVLTQAFAWLNSASAAGSAGAATIAGRSMDAFGARAGFAVALTAAVAMCAFAMVGVRALRGPEGRRIEP